MRRCTSAFLLTPVLRASSATMRLLMIEFLPWRDWQKTLLAIAAGVSVAIGLLFALNVVA